MVSAMVQPSDIMYPDLLSDEELEDLDPISDDEWRALNERQAAYDALLAYFDASDPPPAWRQTAEAWELHHRMIRILNG